MQRPGGSEEWERLLRQGRDRFSNWSSHVGKALKGMILFGGIAVLLLIWLSTGVYIVDPDEQALVRRFGKVSDIAGPGLHWHPPAPIAKHDIVKVTQVQRMEVGFRSQPSGVVTTNPVEALMITGDENIVDVEMVVLYRISSIRDFVLNVRDPGELDRGIGDRPDGRTLKDVAEVSLRGVIGQRIIDDVLTSERGIIEQEVKDNMVKLLNLYQAGILVEQVQLQTVRAPDQVQAAFDDVVSAKEDKERLDNEAQAYAADIVPRAQGNGERLLNEARAFEAQRINEAQGRAAEFLAVLEEYTKAPDVTRERLYLEAMERILPKVQKFILDGDTGSPLQFLPLTGSQTEGGAQ
jgi:membrane protease subunit HflK